jgi:hypothetical protein
VQSICLLECDVQHQVCLVQGQALHWDVIPSHDYAYTSPPGELVAAGDTVVHGQALELLDWSTQDSETVSDIAYQTT